jgi:hypothetical protein
MWSNTINSLFVKEGENLCASLFVEGVCVESSRFPHWIGKTADQILDIIEDGVQEIASRRGVSLHRFENRDLALNELDA